MAPFNSFDSRCIAAMLQHALRRSRISAGKLPPPSSFPAVKRRRVIIPQAEGAWQRKNGTILRCGSQRTPWTVAAVGARIMMLFEDTQYKIGSESDFAIFVQTEGGWQTFDSSFDTDFRSAPLGVWKYEPLYCFNLIANLAFKVSNFKLHAAVFRLVI
jgi:hypothetical protein